jgi:hypothetical protein
MISKFPNHTQQTQKSEDSQTSSLPSILNSQSEKLTLTPQKKVSFINATSLFKPRHSEDNNSQPLQSLTLHKRFYSSDKIPIKSKFMGMTDSSNPMLKKSTTDLRPNRDVIGTSKSKDFSIETGKKDNKLINLKELFKRSDSKKPTSFQEKSLIAKVIADEGSEFEEGNFVFPKVILPNKKPLLSFGKIMKSKLMAKTTASFKITDKQFYDKRRLVGMQNLIDKQLMMYKLKQDNLKEYLNKRLSGLNAVEYNKS